jgi:flagellar hook-associated protein FlgK
MDSVLQVLRDQTDELVRGSLEEFRQQVAALVRDAEAHLRQRAEASYEDFESSINSLGGDLADQLTRRTQEIVEPVKEAIHAKVEEMFSGIRSSPQGNAANPPSKK